MDKKKGAILSFHHSQSDIIIVSHSLIRPFSLPASLRSLAVGVPGSLELEAERAEKRLNIEGRMHKIVSCYSYSEKNNVDAAFLPFSFFISNAMHNKNKKREELLRLRRRADGDGKKSFSKFLSFFLLSTQATLCMYSSSSSTMEVGVSVLSLSLSLSRRHQLTHIHPSIHPSWERYKLHLLLICSVHRIGGVLLYIHQTYHHTKERSLVESEKEREREKRRDSISDSKCS